MAKEKNYNPVQEQKKADKAKALRKQKATVQAQRNEKLARRNPARIQRDIDQLKDLDQSGALRPHERQRLTELEKDLAAVNKARTALGDKAPQFKPERRHDDFGDRGGREAGRGRGGGVLGKRTRDGQRKEDDSSDTDADVANIPMPRDTPPPIPRQRHRQRNAQDEEPAPEPKKAQIVYEAAPQKRDFLKEATKFMPAAVAQKMKLAKGEGRLLEPEEFDKLREDGYMGKEQDEPAPAPAPVPEADPELDAFLKTTTSEAAEQAAEAMIEEAEYNMMAAEAQGKIVSIQSEAAVAENTLRHVEMEEVEDEDI
ncbi:WW domain binding protein 11-domain-containing protein [Boeremia exigua]|uniref:WW domain binding protein 11-domain-containing protein n=1 Tax=Boeremia exigua TaxID=749465 RepID=UPI001E8E6F0E|nr:WW domain binding protein 11-domain-containing protein [Boeremia exigua]KAH6618880.1 WW domain binding protein 11-domain-containing protein [Boeremia exigua]